MKLSELKIASNPEAIIEAIKSFVLESHAETLGFDLYKYFIGTVQDAAYAIQCTDGLRQFWVTQDAQDISSFALTCLTKEADREMAFYITNAWIRKDLRGTKHTQEWFTQLKDYAKERGCKHIIVVAGRNAEVYQRFLGKQFRTYCTLFKQEI